MAQIPILHVPSLEAVDSLHLSLAAPVTTPVCGVLSAPFPRFEAFDASFEASDCESPDAVDRRVAVARARREAHLEARQLHAARHSAQQAAKVRRVGEEESTRAAELAAHIELKQRQAEERRREWLARRASALTDAQRRRDRARERTQRLRDLFSAAVGGESDVADDCRRLAELSALVGPVLRRGTTKTCVASVPSDMCLDSLMEAAEHDLSCREAQFRLDTLETMLMEDTFAPCATCHSTPTRPQCAANPTGPRHLQRLPAAACGLLELVVPVLFPGDESSELQRLATPGAHRAAARHLVVAHHVVLQRALREARGVSTDDESDWAATDEAAALALRFVRRLGTVLDAVAPSSCADTADDDNSPVSSPQKGQAPDTAGSALNAIDVRGMLLAWDRFSVAATAGEEQGRARVCAGLTQAYVRAAMAERWRQHDIERKKRLAAAAEAEKGAHCAEARRERMVAPKRAQLTQAVQRQLASLLAKIRSVGGADAVQVAENAVAAAVAEAEACERAKHQDPTPCQ